MRKYILLTTIFLMFFLLCSCSTNTSYENLESGTNIKDNSPVSEISTNDTIPVDSAFGPNQDGSFDDPVCEYEIVTYNDVTYHIYSDHAEAVSANRYSLIIIPKEINGYEVTAISNDFCSKKEYGIPYSFLSYEGSAAHDYAKNHNLVCYFFADPEKLIYESGHMKYTESVPIHYIPDEPDVTTWRTYISDFVLFTEDNSSMIDSLVSDYLDNGSQFAYDKLLNELLLRREYARSLSDGLRDIFPQRYIADSYSSVYDDQWKYSLFFPTDDGHYIRYYMINVNGAETWDDFESHLNLIYSSENIHNDFLAQQYDPKFIEVDNCIYYYSGGAGNSKLYRNPEFSLFITYNTIVLHAEFEVYTDAGVEPAFTGEYKIKNYVLTKNNGRWTWDNDVLYFGY